MTFSTGSSPKEKTMSDNVKDSVRAAHDKRVADLHAANAEAEKRQSATPTPTQEENDLLALGLMHPDEKKQSGMPEEVMPHAAARATPQQQRREPAPAASPHPTTPR
jgi:hypothetical protein